MDGGTTRRFPRWRLIVKSRRADTEYDASIIVLEFAAICTRFLTQPVENSSSFSNISVWAENEIEKRRRSAEFQATDGVSRPTPASHAEV